MKIIAVICMLIDHLGLIFFPQQILWRVIGRIAMPIFAFGIARGAFYTSSLERYIKKMLVFALVSQLPYWWVEKLALGRPYLSLNFNIGFTFLVALMIIAVLRKNEEEKGSMSPVQLLFTAAMLIGADVLGFDYGSYGILIVLMCYLVNKRSGKIGLLLIGYTLLTGIYYGTSINYFYLQEIGIAGLVIAELLQNVSEKRLGYFFYIFYPAHLFILCFIKWMAVK